MNGTASSMVHFFSSRLDRMVACDCQDMSKLPPLRDHIQSQTVLREFTSQRSSPIWKPRAAS